MAYPVLEVDRKRRTVKSVVDGWIVVFGLDQDNRVIVVSKSSLWKNRLYQSEDLFLVAPNFQKELKRAYAILLEGHNPDQLEFFPSEKTKQG